MVDGMKFSLIWPAVFVVTAVLYGLIVLHLPFNQLQSTIYLFALIGFWSRLPGVGIPSPLYLLYFADVVDFFSIIIAVNIGAVEGAMFNVIVNIVSRACGSWPRWDIVLKDTFTQYLACMLTPWVHSITGNFEVTMIVYTVFRLVFYVPLRIIPDGTSIIEFVVYEVFGASAALLIVNIIYARIFGVFFDALLKQGVDFNWILFIMVTLTIFYVKRRMFGKAEFPIFRQLAKKIVQFIEKKREDRSGIQNFEGIEKTCIKEAEERINILYSTNREGYIMIRKKDYPL